MVFSWMQQLLRPEFCWKQACSGFEKGAASTMAAGTPTWGVAWIAPALHDQLVGVHRGQLRPQSLHVRRGPCWCRRCARLQIRCRLLSSHGNTTMCREAPRSIGDILLKIFAAPAKTPAFLYATISCLRKQHMGNKALRFRSLVSQDDVEKYI